MAIKIEKLRELEYNELVTLGVIQKDKDLLAILTEEVKLPFSTILTLAKENKLSEPTKTLIQDLFDKIILTKESLIKHYVSISEAKDGTNKTNELPRRYGKSSIQEDIKRQGGKATNVQITALAVNELKNVTINLSTRLINDMLTDKPKLTDEDYGDIRAAVIIVKNKLKEILKRNYNGNI